MRFLVSTVFFFFFGILRRMGKKKASAHHTSTYFHTRTVGVCLLGHRDNDQNNEVLLVVTLLGLGDKSQTMRFFRLNLSGT